MTIQPAVISPASLAITRIGRFYLTRELGRGTIGCVYLGHDPVVGRDIAIKTFNPRLTSAEKKKYEHQFINEARAAGRLSHPHIVTIHDASSEGGTAYIAMEYLQGSELHKLLDRGRRFTSKEVASVIWKLADALHHAHGREVIHRDIKPSNIFMVGDDQPKLIDFGIARAPSRIAEPQENGDAPQTVFRTDTLLGTPKYMSPEQALGKTVDARTDIYSLGAVMYEMLAGHPPFRSDDEDKLLQLIAYKAPPAPHEINPDVPLALSQIVMRAMSKRPEKRYQDAKQMALDVKRYLLKERRTRRSMRLTLAPLVPPEPGPWTAWRRRLRWIAGLPAAAALAIAGMLR